MNAPATTEDTYRRSDRMFLSGLKHLARPDLWRMRVVLENCGPEWRLVAVERELTRRVVLGTR